MRNRDDNLGSQYWVPRLQWLRGFHHSRRQGIKDAVFSELKNAIGVKVVSIQNAYPLFELETKLGKSLDIYEEREIRVLGKKIYAVFSNDSVLLKTEEVNEVIEALVERNYKEA